MSKVIQRVGVPAGLHWTAAQTLALVGVLAMPTLALGVHRGANTAYFIMLAGALLGATCVGLERGRGRPIVLRPFWREHVILVVAMSTPVFAVLFSQMILGEFTGRPYDSLSRLALSMPIAWWLYQMRAERLKMWSWACALGAVIAAWTLWASIPPYDTRPQPPYATAITFGNLSLMLGLFAFLSLPRRITRSHVETAGKIVAGLAGLYGSFLSQARGGWLAFPVIVGVLVLVVRISWRWKLAILCVTLFALVGAYTASPLVKERVDLVVIELNDYRQGQNLESSIGLRMQFWNAAWEMFRENPWSGVGSQNIRAQYEARVVQGQLAPAAATFNHSHNEFLWFMASWGLPGALALLAIYLVPLVTFISMARAGEPRRATAGRMGIVLVTGYVVFGLTEAMFAITMNAAFYAGTLATLLAAGRLDQESEA